MTYLTETVTDDWQSGRCAATLAVLRGSNTQQLKQASLLSCLPAHDETQHQLDRHTSFARHLEYTQITSISWLTDKNTAVSIDYKL